MDNSHLSTLLPALIKCTQLTSINLYDNDISKNVLENFLHHTTSLSQLTTEKYPALSEVYNKLKYVEVEIFSQLCVELMDKLMDVSSLIQSALVPVIQSALVPVTQSASVPVTQSALVPVTQSALVPFIQSALVPFIQSALVPVPVLTVMIIIYTKMGMSYFVCARSNNRHSP
jgi:hypothetical protein